MAVENVDVLQVDTSKGVQSVANLKKEIRALRDQLLGLEQGTKEYNDALLELGNKTHELKEMQEQVRRTTSDFGDTVANVRGAVGGLTGAFQTVLGSLSLMGVEMGDDVKMLKMLSSAMAITQGVSAIDAGVKSFKALTISIRASVTAMSGLKKALLTSGIGAAAVAVGILVSKLSELKREQEEAAEAARKHNEQLKEQLNISNQLSKAESDYYNKQYQQIPVVQALEKRLAESRAYWQEEYRKGNLNNYQLDEKIEADRVKLIGNAGKKMQQLWQQILAHNTEANWKESIEGKKIWDEYFQYRAIAAYGDLEEQKRLMKEWEEFNKKTVKEAKTTTPEEAPKAMPSLNAAENYGSDAGRLEQAERAAQEAALKVATEYQMRRAELIINNETDVADQLLALDMDYRDQREELLRSRLEQGLITQQDFNNELAQLEVEAAELQIEQEERVTEKTREEAEKRKKIQENYANAVKGVATSIATILGSLADTEEQGTERWKALKIAEATISTIEGSIEAFMSSVKSLGMPAGAIVGAAQAAAVLATGFANIKKIQDTKVGGTTSTTSSFSSTNPSAVAVNSTQVTTTRAVQTEADVANLPDTRVYVLEDDITTAQRRVRVTTENATY